MSRIPGPPDTAAVSGTDAQLEADAYFDQAVETVNKQIDVDLRAMMDAFDALIRLGAIQDKDQLRIAQEQFEAEARADAMVRSAQSLTLLSHSLKLSLLMAQQPIANEEEADAKGERSTQQDRDGQATLPKKTLDQEAIDLIRQTAKHKQRCADLLRQICQGEEPDR